MSEQTKEQANWFAITMVIVIVLVMFISGGVIIGLQRAKEQTARQKDIDKMKALTALMNPSNANQQVDSFYLADTQETSEPVPGEKPALQFESPQVMAGWIDKLSHPTDTAFSPFSAAQPVVEGVAHTYRVLTRTTPSEQMPRPRIVQHIREYKVAGSQDIIELASDENDQRIIFVRIKQPQATNDTTSSQ